MAIHRRTRPPMTTDDQILSETPGPRQVERELLARFGEVLHGRDVAPLLGYRSARAFARAAEAGFLPVPIFRMAGRRGWFARTRELAAWLSGSERRRPAEPKGVPSPVP